VGLERQPGDWVKAKQSVGNLGFGCENKTYSEGGWTGNGRCMLTKRNRPKKKEKNWQMYQIPKTTRKAKVKEK